MVFFVIQLNIYEREALKRNSWAWATTQRQGLEALLARNNAICS